MNYHEYIKSSEWRQIRQRRLQFDLFKCRTCENEKRLEVHHVHYRNLGHENIEDLITLCKNCHYAITKSMRRKEKRGLWERWFWDI